MVPEETKGLRWSLGLWAAAALDGFHEFEVVETLGREDEVPFEV